MESGRGAYSEEGGRDLNLICLLQLYLIHQHGLVLGYLLSKISWVSMDIPFPRE